MCSRTATSASSADHSHTAARTVRRLSPEPEAVEHEQHHRDPAALDAAVAHVRQAPADDGVVTLLLRRPGVLEREVLTEVRLTLAEGLEGDSWSTRSSSRTPDRSPHPDLQLNVIGARLALGEAVVEVTAQPHRGCAKFRRR